MLCGSLLWQQQRTSNNTHNSAVEKWVKDIDRQLKEIQMATKHEIHLFLWPWGWLS